VPRLGIAERRIVTRPIVYGSPNSVYVRTVRLALEEKHVAYDLNPVEVFGTGGLPAEHLSRHPFGRIPAFGHGSFMLYESSAITRYVDEAFDSPDLQPVPPYARARMNQAIGVLDSYCYRPLVWDIFVERIRAPAFGRPTDEARIAAALPVAETCLQALTDIGEGGPWLSGDALTLADLHAAPMFHYVRMTPEGRALLDRFAALAAWWDRMAARPSMAKTRPVMGTEGA
jgi:glutathione S-transferase